MEMNTRNVNDVKVVDLNGELDTTTAPDLEAHLKDLQDGGAGKILLNLEKLEYSWSIPAAPVFGSSWSRPNN
jgi:anti-anti-sigma factor